MWIFKRLFLSLCLLFVLSGVAGAVSYCTITGQVLAPDGTPFANGTIIFQSAVTQTLPPSGPVIPPTSATASTDASGNLSSTTLIQGLVVQISACKNGACGAWFPAIVPVLSSANFSTLGVGVLTNLSGFNAMGFKITNVGCPTTANDALAWGCAASVSSLVDTGTSTFTGAATFNGGLTTTNVTDSALTNGECVQASSGGLLTTTGSACVSAASTNTWLNAKTALGCVGDGITNDKDCIQRSLNVACGTDGTYSQQPVYFPPGTYLAACTTPSCLTEIGCTGAEIIGAGMGGGTTVLTRWRITDTNTTTSIGLEETNTEFSGFRDMQIVCGTSTSDTPHACVVVGHDSSHSSQFLRYDRFALTGFGAFNFVGIASGPIHFTDDDIFDQSTSGFTNGVVTASANNTIGIASNNGVTFQLFGSTQWSFNGGLIVSGAANHPGFMCDDKTHGQCVAFQWDNGFYFQNVIAGSTDITDNADPADSSAFFDAVDLGTTSYTENVAGGTSKMAVIHANARAWKLYGQFNNVSGSAQSVAFATFSQWFRYSEEGARGDASTTFSCTTCFSAVDCTGSSIMSSDMFHTQISCPLLGFEVDNASTALTYGNGLDVEDGNASTSPITAHSADSSTEASVLVKEGASQTGNAFQVNDSSGNALWWATVNGYTSRPIDIYNTVYSSAGTPIVTCNAGLVHGRACVVDSAACTRGTSYVAGGGSVSCVVYCNGAGTWVETGSGC